MILFKVQFQATHRCMYKLMDMIGIIFNSLHLILLRKNRAIRKYGETFSLLHSHFMMAGMFVTDRLLKHLLLFGKL